MSNSAYRILLVEDEEHFGAVLKNYLELSKFEVDVACDGNLGLSKFKSNSYDLCLLDVMMPHRDGFSLAAEIKALDSEVPLVFLTARSMKEDQIQGFKLGADDYILKPFDSEVLIHKIRAILARKNQSEETPILYTIGRFTFNPKLRTFEDGQESKRLSPKESALLEILCRHMNDVTPRNKALREIWKNDDYFAKRSMDVYVAKIRKLLKSDPSVQIENIHGAGYRLIVPE